MKEPLKLVTNTDVKLADLEWSYKQFSEILALLNRTAQWLTNTSDKENGYITLGMAIAKAERGVEKMECFAFKPEDIGASSDESS